MPVWAVSGAVPGDTEGLGWRTRVQFAVEALGAEAVRGDLSDVDAITAGAQGTDTAYHLAANTQMFTKVIEDYVRKYPEQWLWVHRRWKTRPEGEKGLY